MAARSRIVRSMHNVWSNSSCRQHFIPILFPWIHLNGFLFQRYFLLHILTTLSKRCSAFTYLLPPCLTSQLKCWYNKDIQQCTSQSANFVTSPSMFSRLEPIEGLTDRHIDARTNIICFTTEIYEKHQDIRSRVFRVGIYTSPTVTSRLLHYQSVPAPVKWWYAHI